MTQLARGALQTWRVSSLTGGGVYLLCFLSTLSFQAHDWLLFRSTCHLIQWTSAALFIYLAHLLYLFIFSATTCCFVHLWCSFPSPPHHFFPTTAFRFPPLLMRPFSASCRPVLWWERVPSRSATRLKAGGLQWGRWERGWVWGRQAGRAGLQWGRGWWWWGGRRSRWARSAAGGN